MKNKTRMKRGSGEHLRTLQAKSYSIAPMKPKSGLLHNLDKLSVGRIMEINEIKSRLSEIVSPDYKWPEIPIGWQLEFIAYSNTEVDLNLLHPVSGVFWTDDNDYIDPPIMLDGNPITAAVLSKAGVPFMTTFGLARVVDRPAPCHLSIVKKG